MNSRQRERQTTRTRGRYAAYEYRCEVCNRGISSQEINCPPAISDSQTHNDIGFVPALCDRCYAKSEHMTREEALRFVGASAE